MIDNKYFIGAAVVFGVFFVIFLAPYLLWSNTDNFYWLWMAKNPSLWWAWLNNDGISIFNFINPHFFGFLLMPVFYLANISVYSPRFIAFISMLIVAFTGFAFHRVVKDHYGQKYQPWFSWWVLLVYFSTYWVLNFIWGGDIAPRFIGTSLFILSLFYIYSPTAVRYRQIKIGFLLGLLYLFHGADLLYLFCALLLCVLLFGFQYKLKREALIFNTHFILKRIVLLPGLLVAALLFFRFTNQLIGLESYFNKPIQYSYSVYTIVDLLKYYYGIPFLLSLFGIWIILSKKKRQITISHFMVSLFILAIIVITFPEQWARATYAMWAQYRNLQYLTIPVAFLSLEGLLYILKKVPYKRTVLIGFFGWLGIFALVMNLNVFVSRAYAVPDSLISITPSPIKEKLQITVKDQSFYRQHLKLFNQLNNELPKEMHGLILTRNWDAAFMGGTILNKDRPLYYSFHNDVAFAFTNRAIMSYEEPYDDLIERIVEHKVNWVITDEEWRKKLQLPVIEASKTIDYWYFDEKSKTYVPGKTYFYWWKN